MHRERRRGRRLDGIADFYLLHDREIVNRVDDSVVRVMDDQPACCGVPAAMRRRHWCCRPVRAGRPGTRAWRRAQEHPVSAQDGQAVLSQHLGDLGGRAHSGRLRTHCRSVPPVVPASARVVAVDLHLTTARRAMARPWPNGKGLELISVQHHFAHIASVLADCGHALDAGPGDRCRAGRAGVWHGRHHLGW